MPSKTQRRKKSSQMSIDSNMTIYEVQAIKDKLIKKIEQSQGLTLDLSKVNEIDTAGLQLLLMLKKMLVKQNKNLKIKETSESVAEVLGLCRVYDFINKQMVSSDK